MRKTRSLPTVLTPEESRRIFSRVDILGPDDCWEWRGPRSVGGYGVTHLRDMTTVQVHRLSYSVMVGAIPSGLVIDHLCRNRACVNPHHLEPVTDRVNVVDRAVNTVIKFNDDETKCHKGHPYGDSKPEVDRSRRCMTCRREAYKRYNAKRNR